MRVVNDRRGSIRVTVRGEALVHAPQGAVRCRCLDISPSGMSLVCPQVIKPKQRVRIETSFKGHRLVFEAVVVRRNRTREGHVLGVRFEATTPAVRDRLSEVLRSMQVQAALAMQACAIVDRLPVLQIPEPEPARAEAPAKGGTQELPVMAMPRPQVEAPEWLDSTMLTPPSQLPSARWARGERPVGLEEGWTEEELVTAHYRPSSDDSQPLSVRRETPPGEPPASLVDAFELEGDGVEAPEAADRTEIEAAVGSFTVVEAPLPDWEAGIVTEADDGLGPVRTGKTMVMHVKDLIAAYAPPLEPELDLDLPEETGPTTAPTTAPRLSDELQAALDRLRRREDASKPAEAPPDEAAPRSGNSARRRRRVSTDVYATPGRDDTQVKALYHAALANLGDTDRGDGS